MRYKFITRAHAKLDPPTNFSRSCWKPLWARVALLMSVFDPDAPPPGSCDLKHIIYSWTNSDWRVFPRIPTLTVKVAQNSSATLQQWEVVDETQSRCYTHTHTHTVRCIYLRGRRAAALTGGFPSLPPGKWVRDSTTWSNEWRRGTAAAHGQSESLPVC